MRTSERLSRLRLVRPEPEPQALAPRPHEFAVQELVIRRGVEILRVLKPVPGGFRVVR
jgi:hypothetical protein